MRNEGQWTRDDEGQGKGREMTKDKGQGTRDDEGQGTRDER
ncbi:MAG: hypothetical protein QME81_03180 [bacterium]|nr:hypothetical protein [bacterium]